MTITLTALATDISEMIGDDNNSIWTVTQVQNAVKRAIRMAPLTCFFEPIYDDTTYTGSNYLAANTVEVAVPSSLLTNGLGTRGPGRIMAMDFRIPYSTTPSSTTLVEWAELPGDEARIDDMQLSAPKIRFGPARSLAFELKIYGIRPILVPSTGTDAITGSDWPGFQEWLKWAAMKLLEGARRMRGDEDPLGHTQKFVLNGQEAKDMLATCRMRPAREVLYVGW